MNDNVTGADLAQLRTIADVHLVEVANVYGEATTAIFQNHADGVFILPGGSTVVKEPWWELRIRADRLLRTTYQNLTETTEALHRLIDDFTATDSDLADEMAEAWSDDRSDTDNPVPDPPTPAPPPPDSGPRF